MWEIDSSGAPVGKLPEIASYADLRAVLSRWGEHLVAESRRPAPAPSASAADLADIRSACDRFDSAAAIGALKEIDARWPASGTPDPELAGLAARAFVVLAAQSLDTLELADLTIS